MDFYIITSCIMAMRNAYLYSMQLCKKKLRRNSSAVSVHMKNIVCFLLNALLSAQ